MDAERDKPALNYSYYDARNMIEACDCADNIPGSSTIKKYNDDEDEDVISVQQREIKLQANPRFFNLPVNTSLSSVLVYTNVYDRAPEVIHAIKWSEELNRNFRYNYEQDPTLSWQYFASSTGFLRQFPAAKWDMRPVDLYDGRMRQWYIMAANSPKDVVILVDRSGSMTGQRYDIARHVVENILETLGPNDFFNVFTFNDTIQGLVDCFNDTMVQANALNIGEYQRKLDDIITKGIANFTLALGTAFEMLTNFKREGMGAHCNQAIMLVSDGVPDNINNTLIEMFKNFTWDENGRDKAVRIFTYLIGKEVADIAEIKWIACSNLGRLNFFQVQTIH